MGYFPIFLDLKNRRGLLVGGGEVGRELLRARIGMPTSVLAKMFSIESKQMSIRFLLCLILCIPIHSRADSVNVEEILSDSYEGFLYGDTVLGWNGDAASRVTSYKKPEIESVSDEVQLNAVCITDRGGDCFGGVLYKEFREDLKGNKFYLVKDQYRKEVWVKMNAYKAKVFDSILIDQEGEGVVLSNNFDATDTSLDDGVPDLEMERNKQLKKILRPFSSKMGSVDVKVPGNTKVLRVKDSYLKPEGQFLDYLLSENSYYFKEEINEYHIDSVMYKRYKEYALVRLYAAPGLTVGEDVCGGSDLNYVWLDTKGFEVEFTESVEVNHPIELLVTEFGRSYSVEEVKEFNGNRYALVLEHLTVINPFIQPDEDRVKSDDYTIPYGWIKIRDDRGRLRFWFSNYYGC
jgi:hypothetical protein